MYTVQRQTLNGYKHIRPTLSHHTSLMCFYTTCFVLHKTSYFSSVTISVPSYLIQNLCRPTQRKEFVSLLRNVKAKNKKAIGLNESYNFMIKIWYPVQLTILIHCTSTRSPPVPFMLSWTSLVWVLSSKRRERNTVTSNSILSLFLYLMYMRSIFMSRTNEGMNTVHMITFFLKSLCFRNMI